MGDGLPAISIKSTVMKEKVPMIKVLRALTGALIFLLSPNVLFSIESDPSLKELLKKIEKPPLDVQPRENLFVRNEIIFGTGNSKAVQANNRAAQLMEKGDYVSAKKILSNALSHAPLFFPYQYNLGLCLIHLNELQKALIHLTKAKNIFPEYAKTYLQIGYIYQRLGNESNAIDSYRKAIETNRKELTALVRIGDIYFNRKQYEMAKKYYEAAISIDRTLPNGLLGLAKIYYIREKYYKALILLRTIDTTGEYDKSLHYYYAECSFNLQDYQTAYEQYSTLLKHRNDKFFLTHSLVLIKHKLDLTKRFIDR